MRVTSKYMLVKFESGSLKTVVDLQARTKSGAYWEAAHAVSENSLVHPADVVYVVRVVKEFRKLGK